MRSVAIATTYAHCTRARVSGGCSSSREKNDVTAASDRACGNNHLKHRAATASTTVPVMAIGEVNTWCMLNSDARLDSTQSRALDMSERAMRLTARAIGPSVLVMI